MNADLCDTPRPAGTIERQTFINGGLVTGAGTGTSDEVPARIPPGAFVLNADAVELLGVGILDVLNSAGDRPFDAELSNGEFVFKPAAVAALGHAFIGNLNALGLLKRAGCLGEETVCASWLAIMQIANSVLNGVTETYRFIPDELLGQTPTADTEAAAPTPQHFAMGGIAMGAGVDQLMQLRNQDRMERADVRADEALGLQKQSAAQALALNGLQLSQAKTQGEEQAAIREHMQQTMQDLQAIQGGDYAPLQRLAGVYNSQKQPFDNGFSVEMQNTPSGLMVNHLDKSGKVVESVNVDKSNAAQLYSQAAGEQLKFISPKFYEASLKKAAELREKEAELQSRKEVAKIYADSSKYGADASAEASRYGADQRADGSIYGADVRAAAARYSADHRAPGRAGGLTAAQERSNTEIDAARNAISGLSPEDIRTRTAKQTDTGRENPSFDNSIARAVALAGRRKIGADDVFDQRNGVSPNGPSDSGSGAPLEQPESKPAPSFDRADVAKRFRSDKAMNNYRLGKDTPQGTEVLDKAGKVIGHYE